MDLSYEILGNNIYQARLAANITPEQAARLLHMSVERYNRIERGESIPTLFMLVNICRAFGAKIDAMLLPCYEDYVIRRKAEEAQEKR